MPINNKSHHYQKSRWAIHINSFKVQHSLLLFLDSLWLGISLSSIRTFASLLGSLYIYRVVLFFLLSASVFQSRCSIITVTREVWYPFSTDIILTLCKCRYLKMNCRTSLFIFMIYPCLYTSYTL